MDPVSAAFPQNLCCNSGMHSRVAMKNLQRFLERLIKESIIKGEG